MTRKDFNAIAAALKLARQDIEETDLLTERERIDAKLGLEVGIDRLLTVLAESNANFDRGRFVKATLLP